MRLAALLAAGLVWATTTAAEDITGARYEGPTDRYAHGILGDAIEHGELVLTLADGKRKRLVLPESRVFEDTAPRLFDVDGDGDREVIVVESDQSRGARLSIYGSEGLEAATDYIGRSNRWLAPTGIGAADLDGDGQIELAYVDRPHLAKTLRIFRFRKGKLAIWPICLASPITASASAISRVASGNAVPDPRSSWRMPGGGRFWPSVLMAMAFKHAFLGRIRDAAVLPPQWPANKL